MDEISRRNAETVKLTLKEMYKKIEDQQIRIDGLNASVSTLTNRVNEQQVTISMLRAMLMGTGPTGKRE